MRLVLRVVLLWLLFVGELQAAIKSSQHGPAPGMWNMNQPQVPGYPSGAQVNFFQPRSSYKPMSKQPQTLYQPQPRSRPERPLPERPPPERPWPAPPPDWLWPWHCPWPSRWPSRWPCLWPPRPWPRPWPPRPRPRPRPLPQPIPERPPPQPWPTPELPQPRAMPQQPVPGYHSKTGPALGTEGSTGMSGTRLTSGRKSFRHN